MRPPQASQIDRMPSSTGMLPSPSHCSRRSTASAVTRIWVNSQQAIVNQAAFPLLPSSTMGGEFQAGIFLQGIDDRFGKTAQGCLAVTRE
jgi:hypothetical protein